MKFIKIGKTPFIANEQDRWGQSLPTFMVYNDGPGFVEQSFWKEIQEFENHSIEKEVAEVCFATGLTIQGNLNELMDKLPITSRLIKRAYGQLWQFNMLLKPRTYQEGDDMIRSFAVLGERSIKRWTFVDDIKLAYLRWKCARMNKAVNDTRAA